MEGDQGDIGLAGGIGGEGAAAGPTQQLRAVTVHHQDMVPGAVITGINVQGGEGDENPLVVRDSDSVGMVDVVLVVAGVVGGLEDPRGWVTATAR